MCIGDIFLRANQAYAKNVSTTDFFTVKLEF